MEGCGSPPAATSVGLNGVYCWTEFCLNCRVALFGVCHINACMYCGFVVIHALACKQFL